jgi:inner membrane protein
MITELIDEREHRRDETVTEITEKWGEEQEITGPVIIVPYSVKTRYSNGSVSTTEKYFHILPSELNIDAELSPSVRYRSIYKVITYNSQLKLDGKFIAKDLENRPTDYQQIHWEQAHLVMGLSDLRGVTKNIELNWNNETSAFSPGKYNCSIVKTGVNTPIVIRKDTDYNFSIEIALNGSEAIYFTPVGSSTNVNLNANWNTPSFGGSFLPATRDISDTGFTAQWNVIEMNRTYPQTFSGSDYEYNEWEPDNMQRFGVQLLMPVDTYQKSTRSVKYAFLFIILTFLIVFFSEVLGKKRIHPVQYFIIGLGLVIFYSLLVALAEHISFNLSYLIASVVIIVMITLYIQAIFKVWKTTISISGTLLILYLFLFTVLQIADYALLLGNIGLLIILGMVMLYSKKVDWYGTRSLNNEKEELENA